MSLWFNANSAECKYSVMQQRDNQFHALQDIKQMAITSLKTISSVEPNQSIYQDLKKNHMRY